MVWRECSRQTQTEERGWYRYVVISFRYSLECSSVDDNAPRSDRCAPLGVVKSEI